jgi:hypothetical protein
VKKSSCGLRIHLKHSSHKRLVEPSQAPQRTKPLLLFTFLTTLTTYFFTLNLERERERERESESALKLCISSAVKLVEIEWSSLFITLGEVKGLKLVIEMGVNSGGGVEKCSN